MSVRTKRYEPTVQLDSGLILPAGAAVGNVLTSDADGNATWQAPRKAVLVVAGSVSIPSETAGSLTGVGFGGATPTVDTMSGWSSADSVYTPQFAGYYWVAFTFLATVALTSGDICDLVISKNNGDSFQGYQRYMSANSGIGPNFSGSGLVHANGSTDYIGLFGGNNSGAGITGSLYLSITS